ncbi:hypothetical protein BJV78DRAFT_543422 [Lactifluus subvellereus]|nr:hypothetical protein BJV78DRAFT_543422 [Lactifluus subvellereus]
MQSHSAHSNASLIGVSGARALGCSSLNGSLMDMCGYQVRDGTCWALAHMGWAGQGDGSRGWFDGAALPRARRRLCLPVSDIWSTSTRLDAASIVVSCCALEPHEQPRVLQLQPDSCANGALPPSSWYALRSLQLYPPRRHRPPRQHTMPRPRRQPHTLQLQRDPLDAIHFPDGRLPARTLLACWSLR